MSILGAQQDVCSEGQEHILKCGALMEDKLVKNSVGLSCSE